jgi:hypothetical protein
MQYILICAEATGSRDIRMMHVAAHICYLSSTTCTEPTAFIADNRQRRCRRSIFRYVHLWNEAHAYSLYLSQRPGCLLRCSSGNNRGLKMTYTHPGRSGFDKSNACQVTSSPHRSERGNTRDWTEAMCGNRTIGPHGVARMD